MFRRWSISISVAGSLIAAAVGPGMAQEVYAVSQPCSVWTPVVDKPGTWLYVYSVAFVERYWGVPGESEGRDHGLFDIPAHVP
jgi:hypothetical protein